MLIGVDLRRDSVRAAGKTLISRYSTSSSLLWKACTCDRWRCLKTMCRNRLKIIRGRSHIHIHHSPPPRRRNNPADIEHRSPACFFGGTRSRSTGDWWPENKQRHKNVPLANDAFDALWWRSVPTTPLTSSSASIFREPTPHLTGHCNLGFGGRLCPQMVGLAVHEAHPQQEVLHDLLKERVVPEDLCSYVGIFYLQEQFFKKWDDELMISVIIFLETTGNLLTSWSSWSPASRSSRATTFSTSSTWQNTVHQGERGQNPRWNVIMNSALEINACVMNHLWGHREQQDGLLPQSCDLNSL